MPTVTKIDYYELLEVSRSASDAELKTSYRKLAMQYHPDRNPNNPAAEAKFKECSEAYQVLSDPDKRAAYDRYGHAAFQGGGPAAGNPFTGNPQDLGDIFGDLFGEMFNMGGQRKASRVQRGRDLRYDLTLAFEEAVFGKEQEITIRRMEVCEDCSGTGSANGKPPITCTQCNGHGQVRFQQGFFSVARTCSVCNGTGTLVVDACKTCRGETRVQKEHTLLVKVPAGVEQDTRIRYQARARQANSAAPPATSTLSSRSKRTSSSSATGTISTASSPSLSRRPPSARNLNSRHSTAPPQSKSLKAPSPARSSSYAAKAFRT